MTAKTIRLGLIGDNIAASQSPRLHGIAGRLCGLTVTYERLVPPQRNQTFEEVFAFCGAEGFTGINVTYPTRSASFPFWMWRTPPSGRSQPAIRFSSGPARRAASTLIIRLRPRFPHSLRP